MSAARPLKPGKAHLVRLPAGSDILEYLTGFCVRRRIRCASIQAIGAVSEACVGYYDQVRHEYHKKTFRQELEILSCAGNASLKGGAPFLHLHVVLGDTKLRAWGGHLFPGSKVFSCEAWVQELLGSAPIRSPDPATGLALWTCPSK